MVDFIIDEPYHKRWRLPDGLHLYNSVLYGDHFKVSVINALTGRTVVSVPPVHIDKEGNWKEILELTQALAEKKFCKRLSP